MSSGDTDSLGETKLSAPQVLDAEGLLRKEAIRSALLGRTTDQAGQRVGRYVVERKLGQGGMGVVFAARDPVLDRTVAIKLLRGIIDDGDGGLERSRLVREAQALARLRHPAVATVHEVDTHDDQLYLAMEYVDGQTLERWLAERPRPWQQITAAFVRAGEGLSAAHAAGIVHRDFKPANVMVDRDDRVVVLDFGLARSSDGTGNDNDDDDDEDAVAQMCTEQAEQLGASGDLTMTGTAVGTPAYMSPEQFLGIPATAATDQWSFCVALYEALSGQRPFAGTSIAEQARLVTLGRGPEGGLESVPRRVRRAVLRGLMRRPEDRWPSMDALLDLLRRALEPRRSWWWGLGVGVAGMGVAGVALSWSMQAEQAAEQEIATVNRKADDAQRMQAALGLQESDPAAAVALLREVEQPQTVKGWTEASHRLLARPICEVVGREHGAQPLQTIDLSPDGRFLLTGSRDTTARLWSADGRGKPWVANDAGMVAARFSPDGRTIATIGTVAQLWQWDGRGEPVGPTVLPNGPKPLTDDTTRAIAFDSAGRRLATGSNSGVVYLWTVPEDGAAPAEPQALAGHEAFIWNVAFSPDGTQLLSSSVDGAARLWSLDDEVSPIVLEHGDRVFSARFSPDGSQVLTASLDRSARLWSTDDGALQTRWDHDTPLFSATFAPDGRRVLVGDDGGAVVQWDPASSVTSAVVVHRHEAAVTGLSTSSAGQQIASASDDGTVAVWTMPSVGEALQSPRVLHIGESIIDVAHAPDGHSVVLAAQAGTVRVCSTEPPTSTSVEEVTGRTSALAATADGTRLLVGSSAGSTLLTETPDVSPLTLDDSRITHVALDATGSSIVTRDASGTLRAWSEDGRPTVVPEGVGQGAVAIDPSGQRMAALGPDATVLLFERTPEGFVRSGSLNAVHPVLALALTEHAVLVGDDKGRLITWPHDGSGPREVATRSEPITHLVAGDRGVRLATSHRDGEVNLWRWTEGGWTPGRSFRIGDEISTMAWIESGSALLVMTWTGQVLRIDADDNGNAEPTLVASLPFPKDSPFGLLRDDGRVALTSSGWDGTVMRWTLSDYDPDLTRLQARLWEATTECLDPATRVELLGIDEATARDEHARCNARFGR